MSIVYALCAAGRSLTRYPMYYFFELRPATLIAPIVKGVSKKSPRYAVEVYPLHSPMAENVGDMLAISLLRMLMETCAERNPPPACAKRFRLQKLRIGKKR